VATLRRQQQVLESVASALEKKLGKETDEGKCREALSNFSFRGSVFDELPAMAGIQPVRAEAWFTSYIWGRALARVNEEHWWLEAERVRLVSPGELE